MKIEKTEVTHYVDKSISTILKGLFCMLAIWFGIWLIKLDTNIAMFIPHLFGGIIVGAAGIRLSYILIKELW